MTNSEMAHLLHQNFTMPDMCNYLNTEPQLHLRLEMITIVQFLMTILLGVGERTSMANEEMAELVVAKELQRV